MKSITSYNFRTLLLDQSESHALDDRFHLAKSMAKSVAYMHTFNFVHKNISPYTVIVFSDSKSTLGRSFLIGFEKFRPAGGVSDRLGDLHWEKNIYHHPRRQGSSPEEDYKMQHDIYSLGVCLLEIGLWSSLVVPTPEGAKVGKGLGIGSILAEKDQTRKALKIKDTMVLKAKELLPTRMGRRYTEVVIRCLTCLDKEANIFGDESSFFDEDGIKVGVRYIEKVLGELEQVLM